MKKCQKEIESANIQIVEIDKKIENIPERIKEANLALLEVTISEVYLKLKTAQKRINELVPAIEGMKEKLKNDIAEKEQLSEIVEDAYSYFHDLLGGEEVEKLDKQFLL